MSDVQIDLDELERAEQAVAKSDEGQPWQQVKLIDGWSIGPDYEMGHRAELADWCDDEGYFLVAIRNAAPALIAAVRMALDADPGWCIGCGTEKGYGHTEDCALAPFSTTSDERKDVTT